MFGVSCSPQERDDPELVALYFRFGRYLTIAGSRHDSPLPLALQGLWNDGLASSAPWTNDFHLDMNTQQNYWAAEVTDLGECQEPLLKLVDRLRITGRSTARDMYGANGWVAHTVTNAWGYSAPGWGMGWGMNVTAGAWIALQHWEHWDYNRDLEFLRERAYPVLKEAAEFFLDYMVAHPTTGWLVTGPSDSPENWYLSSSGQQCAVSMGPTCDRVFVEAVLRNVVEAAHILDVDTDLVTRVQAAREQLPPFQVGRFGQLQEWLDDFEEAVPSHRHTSHLMALYPERQISPRQDPELAKACEVTIERREAAPGWEQTEWVEANLIAYYARLLKGDLALEHVRNLIADASEANLMSFSAGGVAGAEQNIYSFDGNAGGTAGIAEMLAAVRWGGDRAASGAADHVATRFGDRVEGTERGSGGPVLGGRASRAGTAAARSRRDRANPVRRSGGSASAAGGGASRRGWKTPPACNGRLTMPHARLNVSRRNRRRRTSAPSGEMPYSDHSPGGTATRDA